MAPRRGSRRTRPHIYIYIYLNADTQCVRRRGSPAVGFAGGYPTRHALATSLHRACRDRVRGRPPRPWLAGALSACRAAFSGITPAAHVVAAWRQSTLGHKHTGLGPCYAPVHASPTGRPHRLPGATCTRAWGSHRSVGDRPVVAPSLLRPLWTVGPFLRLSGLACRCAARSLGRLRHSYAFCSFGRFSLHTFWTNPLLYKRVVL